MGQGLDLKINRLPARTWNWLKMNESKLKDIETGDTCEVEKIIGKIITVVIYSPCLTPDKNQTFKFFFPFLLKSW